jgi:hypothetical protein
MLQIGRTISNFKSGSRLLAKKSQAMSKISQSRAGTDDCCRGDILASPLVLWRDMWELGSGNKVKIPLSWHCKLQPFHRIDPIERRAVARRDGT